MGQLQRLVTPGQHAWSACFALYLKAFEQPRKLAVYGAQARVLILKAIEVLS